MKKFKSILTVIATAMALLSCAKEEPEYTIAVDQNGFKDIAANNPSVEALVITTDAPYWIISVPEWVTPDVSHGVGGGNSTIVALNIASNYKNIATTTYARSGEIKISGGKTSVSIPINQLGHTAVFDPDASIGGITNLEEFLDFVETINDGEAPIRWMNQNMEIELLADLDLSGLTQWVPIGDVESSGNSNTASKVRGNPFSGVFNGGGHTIRNFNASADLSDGRSWGLFGYISHATIKDLNVEADINLTASGTADAGVVAGTVYCSTIENVTVKASITSSGTTSTHRFAIGGIAGFVFGEYTPAETFDSYIKDCKVTATVNLECGTNTSNGADCMMYGGIAAVSTNAKDNSRNHILNCVNNGTMTVNIGRCSGILPTANYGTYIEHCTNNASQVNTIPNGRVGQICCNLSAESHIIDCANTGNLTTTGSQTTTAAVVALMGEDSVYIEGGARSANTGTIIGANTRYLSLLCANNNRFDHISDVILSGKLGKYKANGNHEMYGVNASNIMQYIGYINPDYADRITGVSYMSSNPNDHDPEDPPEGENGIRTADDLKAFAAAVNSGASLAQWQNSAGEVQLLADIDLGGEEWTPIGNCSVDNVHVIIGNAFTKVFNGRGHAVDNFKVTIPSSGQNVVAGLFGAVSGATVKNLVIGDKVVISNSSVSGYVSMGAAVAFASESTLENIDSYARLSSDGGKDGVRLVVGGAIGTMYSADDACVARNISGHAHFNVVNSVNANNGGNGISIGGVIGYTAGRDAQSSKTRIENCTNYSSFNVQATRTGGVIGTMNNYTIAEGCINFGDISCTAVKPANSRVAGIVSAMGNYTGIKNCVNYGDIAFAVPGDSTHGYAAGLVGQTNDANDYESYIEGCASYGTVQSDMWFNTAEQFMGIVCASFNAKKITVKNCILGGKIGPYVPTSSAPVVTLSSANFSDYYSLTAASRKANVKFEGNSFGTRP